MQKPTSTLSLVKLAKSDFKDRNPSRDDPELESNAGIEYDTRDIVKDMRDEIFVDLINFLRIFRRLLKETEPQHLEVCWNKENDRTPLSSS